MANAPSLLPPNATTFERALEQAGAGIADLPTPIRSMWNPDTCPVALLPWLAWGFGVDRWDTDWTESQKREAIKNALFVQKHKGTIGAVKRALGALGYDITVQEWFNQIPAGDPFTFDVLIDSNQTGYDAAALDLIRQLIETYKNLRSHLTGIKQSITTLGGPVLAGVLTMGNEITIPFDASQLHDRTLDGSWTLDGSVTLIGLKV
jgi:phage tail P2-like protein